MKKESNANALDSFFRSEEHTSELQTDTSIS